MANALIQKLDVIDRGNLADEYLAMAYNVEQSLLLAGAVPGKDYTLLDLYKLAQPLVIELFRDNSRQMKYDIPVW
ncbi:hypothetical protein SF06_22310 [Pseudomonas flexibilis]|uniref:Uncharacterized protein n=1 Tax=Pseudomonas flexibilis TaxID=706570 RepID=A0A1N6UGJ4_9PSED|nr:hypothetical protein [Pseudomonas flexibilis]KHL68895.1 hypothetical protein SF06_22310 [Pseudomonas flexibilis]SIQ64693.1 hypothetical protein SAMN05421672_108139 [Pseudomonas flexibilis]